MVPLSGEGKIMNNRLLAPVLALSLALTAACAGPKRMSQVRVGVWAAERDLWEEAVFRWSRVLETEPNSAVARNNLAVAYEKMGRVEDARREYELALKLAPNQPQIKANFQRFKLAREIREEKPPKKSSPEEKHNDIR
jgi:Flp pilus assembly protein TadD